MRSIALAQHPQDLRPRAMSFRQLLALFNHFRSYAVGASLGHSNRYIWGVLADHSHMWGSLPANCVSPNL